MFNGRTNVCVWIRSLDVKKEEARKKETEEYFLRDVAG